ncbi:tyrosine-type recombinase/integrase [Rothia terrae]|uniref:Tyrosine-type recombinase/integrase n=1 Tax=Rothia terrae TaxID=396015 RepID=A0A7H2BD11_9MICC|nr:tyrosine-type recombinase/integrase [Rothia terrae]QNV37557.1 tyrosine-type recombinase/integrase [Rothia terrae]
MSKRRYGGGSVSKYTYRNKTRSTTKWRWQLRTTDPDTGEEKHVGKSGYTTEKEALKGLAEARERYATTGKAKASKLTVEQFAQEWLDGRRVAPSTLQADIKIVRNHITPYIGSTALDALTASRIKKLYTDLLKHGRKDRNHEGEPLSPNTVNKVHNVLQAILDSAVHSRLIMVNPAKDPLVNAPKSKEINAAKEEIAPWSAGQLKDFLAWSENVYRDDLFMLWHIYAVTGMRRGEALALRWSDFDPVNMTLAVRHAVDPATPGGVKLPKGGKARVLDISAGDVQKLKAWRGLRAQLGFELVKQDAYIFGNDSGGVRSPNEVSRRWRRRMSAATQQGLDVPVIKLHDLRHTHATLLLQAGVHPKVVQERLGHSTITITLNTYSHVIPTMQRGAVDSFTSLIA